MYLRMACYIIHQYLKDALNYNLHYTTTGNALDFINNVADDFFSAEYFNIVLKKLYDAEEKVDHVIRNAYNKE